MMAANLNKHGTVVCSNCGDLLRSVHMYKLAAGVKLVDTTPTICGNCGFSATWSVVKPQ